jgi:nicotinamide riboside kinase
MPKIAFVKKVALVGTISNAESNLKSDLLRVMRALSSFELVKIFLVESDSTDSTVSVLDELSLEIEKFE